MTDAVARDCIAYVFGGVHETGQQRRKRGRWWDHIDDQLVAELRGNAVVGLGQVCGNPIACRDG